MKAGIRKSAQVTAATIQYKTRAHGMLAGLRDCSRELKQSSPWMGIWVAVILTERRSLERVEARENPALEARGFYELSNALF
jgi:hypothetical protein